MNDTEREVFDVWFENEEWRPKNTLDRDDAWFIWHRAWQANFDSKNRSKTLTPAEEKILSAKIKKEYCQKYGLRPLPSNSWPTCVDSILRARGKGRRNPDEMRHRESGRGPHADHNSGFRDIRTGEIVGVEQPYYGYPPATLEQITKDVEAFAIAHGLKVRVSTDESWHCPGKTVLIEYRRSQIKG